MAYRGPEKKKENNRKYRESHKEEIREYQRKYRETHKKQRKERDEENKEIIKKKREEYNADHREENRQYNIKYKEENREKINKRKMKEPERSRTNIRRKHLRNTQWNDIRERLGDVILHHEWIGETAEYRGCCFIDKMEHLKGVINPTVILEGEITEFESPKRRGIK